MAKTTVENAALTSVLQAPTASTLPMSRLAPEAALRRLELTVVRRLEGFLHGDHQGLIPGPGSETNDARSYVPGQDDVRRIDWAVTARTGVTHVRDTIADRELEIWSLLDASPSMNWGTAGVTKRDLGIAAIATIAFLSQKVGDRFGSLVMHPDHIRRFPARSGRSALYGMLRSLLCDEISADRTTGAFDLPEGITHLANSQRRRGLRLIVSDFTLTGDTELDPNIPPAWERPLRRLSARNQVLCVEVLDPHEIEFPNAGEILIRDPETTFQRYVNTADTKARARMNQVLELQRERVRMAMRRAGVGHIQLRTDRDWVQDIARFVLGYRRIAHQLHQPPQGVAK